MFRFLSLPVAVAVCVLCVESAAAAGRGAELAREMQRTGKPALIIAGNEGCVYCRQMAEELATDRSLQPLARQYLILKIDTESADWPRLRETFQFDESGIPAVFVVRADGELMYSNSGKPVDMAAFLERYLESAGTILDPDRLQEIQRAVRQANRHLKRRDYGPLLPIVQEYAGSGSYAEVARTMDAIQAALLSQVSEDVTRAEEQITSREEVLGGALSLAKLKRILADYEPAAAIVESAWARLAGNETQTTLLEQAATLDRAAVLATERKWNEAAGLYEWIVATADGTPTGEYAAEHLAEVRARASVAAASTDERPASESGESGGNDERAAAAHLKFARLYLERDEEKAREYLQRAIDSAPDSDAAAEARELLEQLGDPD